MPQIQLKRNDSKSRNWSQKCGSNMIFAFRKLQRPIRIRTPRFLTTKIEIIMFINAGKMQKRH